MNIFLVFLVFGVIYFAVVFGLSCLGGFALVGSMGPEATGGGFNQGLQAGQAAGGPVMGVFQIVMGCIGAIVMTFQATLAAVIYHDLREIKEGTGVDELLGVFE